MLHRSYCGKAEIKKPPHPPQIDPRTRRDQKFRHEKRSTLSSGPAATHETNLSGLEPSPVQDGCVSLEAFRGGLRSGTRFYYQLSSYFVSSKNSRVFCLF